MSKYFNNVLIGNSKILGCLTDRGELIRLYYPNIDYFQNIDTYKIGITKDNRVVWTDNFEFVTQYYEGNIAHTKMKNGDILLEQIDYVLPDKNVLVRKFCFSDEVNLVVYSKVHSNVNKLVSGMVVQDTLIQYCQDMYMASFSNLPISNYQINNVQNSINSAILNNKDYIGMSADSAISYEGVKEFTLYIAFENNLKGILKLVDELKNVDESGLYSSTKKYWNAYLDEHLDAQVYKNCKNEKERSIIERSVLMFKLLSDNDTGAILASADVDENFTKCGRYGYCWPRDALFINQALSYLKMDDIINKFYSVWVKKAQFDSGLFEQRYYSNGELAPSWGIQIDETASILIGLSEQVKCKQYEDVIIKATLALINFLDENGLSKPCYDIWEERRTTHLYSTASIYEALNRAKIMLRKINPRKYKAEIERIEKILPKMLNGIRKDFVENGVLKRSIDSSDIDISMLALATPFDIFDINNPIVTNTVQEIEKKLSLENGGYLRYENDNYIGGGAWIISSLWLSMYYLKLGNKEKAKELFDWVTNHADNLGFLPEQIERNGNNTLWVSQLSWSHAMYVIVKSKM